MQRAQDAGIPLWNIIADPGIGFAKTQRQSAEITRGMREACPSPLPILAGPSRKGYLSQAVLGADVHAPPQSTSTHSDSAEHTQEHTNTHTHAPVGKNSEEGLRRRDWATAAALTACVSSGSDIVRVHNPELLYAVRTADMLYRNQQS